jgi:MYXO-CTERM domain-containing protein
MRRIGRLALAIGIAVIAGVVTLVLTAYVMLRVDPSTMLSSCGFSSTTVGGITHTSPQVCTPESPWGVLPYVTGVLVAAAVGIALFIRRRRGHPQTGGIVAPVVPTSN